MTTFRIIAQSFTSGQRIARNVQAISEIAALRSVVVELDTAGFYVVQITQA